MRSPGDAFYDTDLYDELEELSLKLEQWYSIDRIKWYAVYINIGDAMAFDIFADEIVYYEAFKGKTIPDEAMVIIKEIQEKLMEIDKEFD